MCGIGSLPATNLHNARSTTLSGSFILTDAEAYHVSLAKHCALQSYHFLSHAAATHLPVPKFRYPIKPKLHKLDHLCRLAAKNRINPGWTWGFSDEYLVGRIAKLSAATHASSVATRAAERWVAFFTMNLGTEDAANARGASTDTQDPYAATSRSKCA